MRILIAGQTFYKKNNGQGVFTINLAEGLAHTGHEVLLIIPSAQGRPYRQNQPGLTIQTVPTLPFNDKVNITAFSQSIINQAVAQFRPQLVHIQDHYFISRAVLQAARRQQIVQVGTNHFLPENLTYNLRIPGWFRKPVNRWLWQTMLDVFNTLHAVTTPTETAVRILRQQRLQSPVQAISCGVDQSRFKPRPGLHRAEIRRRYNLDPAKTLFMYVGRIDREKGLDVLLHALHTLRRDDLQLAIVGQPSGYMADLSALSQRLAVHNQVIFTGFVPSDDLPLLLNSADIFAMPSGAELQSIATLEAMSSGLPVLAARARALPELVEPHVNGYLFELNNAADAARGLAALADKRAEWASMGATSLAKAGLHSLANTIQRYANFYQTMLAYPYIAKVNPARAARSKEQQVVYH
jgi:1,2-diacylglycerol 3-alpha-glucosyltransferase